MLFSRLIILFTLVINYSNSFCQIIINELLSSNVYTCPDPDIGAYTSWLELYNSDSKSIDISGYFITNDINNTKKWQIPKGTVLKAKQYFIIWTDGLNKNPKSNHIENPTAYKKIVKTISDCHTNFVLDSKKGTIAIYNSSKQLIDSVSYKKQTTDISYGRVDKATWAYFENPSPGKINDSIFCKIADFTLPPKFSLKGGVYSNSKVLKLTAVNPNDSIRYTTNGTIPNRKSQAYTNPIVIDSTTVIYARSFRKNALAGDYKCKTFIITKKSILPFISITTDPENLWNPKTGIYVVGNKYKKSTKKSVNSRNSANFNQGWEKPMYIEYYSEEGKKIFASSAGMKVHGRWISCLPQKPIGVYFDEKYGKSVINYQLFKDKPIFEFKDFILRNYGDGWLNFLIRDATCSNIIKNQMDIDYQSYRPVIVYLNGKYWGIHSMREKLNSNYITANHTIDTKSIDILEDDTKQKIVIKGSAKSYNEFTKLITPANFSKSEVYEKIKNQLDINEYLNYQIIRMFFAYITPDHNNKYYKPSEKNSKWRWMVFDLENSKAFLSTQYNHATIKELSGNDWSRVLFTALIKNNEFKNHFIQRFASYLNTTFKTERVISIISETANEIAPEMPNHIKKWGNVCSEIYPKYCGVKSMDDWLAHIDTMKIWAKLRPDFLRKHIAEYFKLTGTAKLKISAINGKIKIENVIIPDIDSSWTYFKNVPISIEAIPEIGYKFVKWLGTNDSLPSISFILNKNDTLQAVFEPIGKSILPEKIEKKLILVKNKSPYYASGDINIGKKAILKIQEGVEILMPDNANITVEGRLIANGSEKYPIIIKSNSENNARHEFYNDYDYPHWGAICFDNAKKSKLNYLVIDNATRNNNNIIYKAAINSFKTKLILNNVIEKDAAQPFYSEYGDITIKNCTFSSQSVCDLINIKYAHKAIVESCNFTGNTEFDTDAIDFDGISNGKIINNRICGFFGYNSDGIDIGEQAENILIKDNFISNCNDKAISVGQASSAIVENNIISNCGNGIGIKDSKTFAKVEKNTFYNNQIDIECFEKNRGKGGGKAEVANCIFYNSLKRTYYVDSLSSISFSGSISNTTKLPGENNLCEPQFVNASKNNFTLKDTIICQNNENLSKLNIGAKLDIKNDYSLIINEINYNSTKNNNSYNWIELYNYSNDTIDISGWIFKNKSDKNSYHLPDNSFIKPTGYFVLCRNSKEFHKAFPNVKNYTGDFDFDLNDESELLRLFDKDFNIVNSFIYNSKNTCPVEEVGKGKTLELKNFQLDGSRSTNWKFSKQVGGTPGRENS